MAWIKAIKWLLFIAFSLSLVYFVYNLGYGAGYDSADISKQKHLYELSRAKLEHQDTLLQLASEKNLEISKITSNYNRTLRDEKQKSDDIIADYELGDLRLRQRFKSRDVVPRTDCTNGNTGEKTSGLQDSDVRFLIRFAERADETAAQLAACQDILFRH